jgi:hypothetical protein
MNGTAKGSMRVALKPSQSPVLVDAAPSQSAGRASRLIS